MATAGTQLPTAATENDAVLTVVETETAAASPPSDPLLPVKEKLVPLIDSLLEHQWTSQLRSDSLLFFSMNSAQQMRQMKSFTARMAAHLENLLQKVANELKQQLQQLQPHQLGELMLSKWMIRTVEERMTARGVEVPPRNHESTRWNDPTLRVVDDVKLIIEQSIDEPTEYEEEEDEEEEDVEMKEEEFNPEYKLDANEEVDEKEWQERVFARLAFLSAIMKHLPTYRAEKFSHRMIPPSKWPRIRRRERCIEGEEKKGWTTILKFANMAEYLKSITNKEKEEIRTVIAAVYIRALKYYHRIWNDDWGFTQWLRDSNELRASIASNRRLNWGSPFNSSPTKLAAYLLNAAASGSIARAVANRPPKKISKKRNVLGSRVQKKFTKKRMKKQSEAKKRARAASKKANRPLPSYITEWAEEQAKKIIRMGMARLATVFEEEGKRLQPVQHDSAVMQQVYDADEQAMVVEDAAEKKRELKMREKVLAMKEEVLERKEAEFELKMEEFEETLNDINARVEKMEEKNDIFARMDEMDERLKKVEEKDDEDDMEIA